MIFFTSDQHYGHRNVIPYCDRPFKDLNDMHETLVERYNAVVGPTDVVYHLGDFSLTRKWVATILPRLNGVKYLVAGNHDECHPVHCATLAKQFRKTEIYETLGFSRVSLYDVYFIAGARVGMHHMPYVGDQSSEERFKDYRPVDNGGWLLHGHVHQLWQVRDKMINVGVDVWDFAPVSLTKIEEIIRAVPHT